MPIPHQHTTCSRYTDDFLRGRLHTIANELTQIRDHCGGRQASLACWCLQAVEDAVRALGARAAFAADGGQR